MSEHDEVDDRIRVAWADLRDDDFVLEPAPDGLWDGIEEAMADHPETTSTGAARRSRSPAPVWLMGAAVATALVVLAVGAFVLRDTKGEVEYRAALTTEGLAVEPGPHGDAVLRRNGGDRRLEVDLADLPAIDDGAVLEAWLLDPDGGGLQSLGLVEDGATFVVPSAIDTDRFSIVDVSIEPTDGNPTHSADSLLRGPLERT